MRRLKFILLVAALLGILGLAGCNYKKIIGKNTNIEMKNWSFQLNEDGESYSFFFGVYYEGTDEVSTIDTDVELRIVNENDEEVYKGVSSVKKSDFGYYTNEQKGTLCLAEVKIPKGEIMEGTSGNGRIYFWVHKENVLDFGEHSMAVYELPVKQLEIAADELPAELNITKYDGTVSSKLVIENVVVETENKYGGVNANIYVEGTKNFQLNDENGYSNYDSFYYKIYDEDGYVVYNSLIMINGISEGDKFREEIHVYDLDLSKKYTISFYAE